MSRHGHIVPDNDEGGVPQRGPWKGFFGANLRNTAILNTYNANDWVLNNTWYWKQSRQEPNVGPLGLFTDDRQGQYWAVLQNTDSMEEAVFASVGSHSNIIRQWAELAYWFKSLSGPIGSRHFPNFSMQSKNCNFTQFAPPPLVPDLDADARTHGYMHSQPFSKVALPWTHVQKFMHGAEPDCDKD